MDATIARKKRLSLATADLKATDVLIILLPFFLVGLGYFAMILQR